jgi:hypothetical protein
VNPSTRKVPPGHKLNNDDRLMFNLERAALRSKYGF